jgi:hypothetical protein
LSHDWQFSVRDLLALTTVVSICLAVGTYFAGIIFALVALGIVQAALLLSADWLIWPQNRHLLAFVTAGAWLTTGSGLSILGIGQLIAPLIVSDAYSELGWALGVAFIAAGVLCIYIAVRRWRQLSSPRSSQR